MNKRILIRLNGIIIFAILFIYLSGYICSGAQKTTLLDIHFERGVRFYKERMYDKAIEELERVLEIDPRHLKASKYLSAAIKKRNKKIVNQLYKEAEVYHKQKEYQKALDAYKNVLEIMPGDGYALYQAEILRAKIEKSEKLKQNAEYRQEQRKKELEKIAKEKLERENHLKKKATLELARKEEERQKKEIEKAIEERIEDKQLKQKEEAPKKIAFEKGIISKQETEPKEDSSESVTIKPAKMKESDASLLEQDSEKEKLKKIKHLFILGKRYYSQGDYQRAIEAFRQVIELEGNPRILYTPYAEKYIEKAEQKLLEQTRRDKIKQIEDIENEMIERVIDAAKVPVDPVLGTVTKDVYLPVPEPKAGIHKKLDIPVNMDFQNVDVVYVLDYLSEQTGANIVMSSAVTKGKRTVSVKIKDMPLEEALRYVLKSAGLTYRIDKNVIWIATPEEIENEQMETKVFTLKKGKGVFTEFKTLVTGSVGLGSAADIGEVTTIKDIIEKAVSWPQGSKIVLDERIGTLIITNTPYNLEIIEKIIEKIDVEPIQVLIEARFLEIEVQDLDELGIDWQIDSPLPFDKTRVGMVQGISEDSGVSFTDTTRQSEGFNLTYQGLLTKPQFQVVLHALEETQKTKTLSSPRITTLDNQMATIKVVDEWIYPTRYEFQIVQNDENGDGDFNDAGETLYKNVPSDFVKRDVGILLRVTPSVGMEDDTITLTLIPEVSEGTADYFSFTGGVTLPLFTSRNLSTSVVVNNGDTVVLGGLIRDTQSKVTTKVPLLGDLPWLGKFFRKDTDSITRRNLLIFVTATIISKSGEEVVLRRIDRSTAK